MTIVYCPRLFYEPVKKAFSAFVNIKMFVFNFFSENKKGEPFLMFVLSSSYLIDLLNFSAF
jgi:hypothetical protein